MSEDFQILVNNIKHQFNLLSKTFFKLSTYLSQLNNYTPSALSTTNTSVSEANSTSFVKKKRLRSQKEKEKTKRILHNKIVGKILPVLCDKNGIKTRGYKVELQYYKLFFVLGPYENYEFVKNINHTIQDELAKLKCNKDNYKTIVTNCFEEIKSALYEEYPILKESND